MYTVSDFQNTYKNSAALVAGAGGVSHVIVRASFLDYELVPELKDKYFHSNFGRDQLVLTSLLYAKDNPYALIDVVKHLASKNAACLVIRNVFHLQISDMVIRYANSKNFPIFLLESSTIFFEDIVLEINQHQELLESFERQNSIINKIINLSLSDSEIKENAYRLNPSFDERFFCIYCKFQDTFALDSPMVCYNRFIGSEFDRSENCLIIGDKGIYFICSGEKIVKKDMRAYITRFIELVIGGDSETQVGISRFHNTLCDFKKGLSECLYASLYCNISKESLAFYPQLNSYKIIFPYAKEKTMTEFSNDLLEPIMEYDTYNNFNFLQTLYTYALLGADAAKTAKAGGQHEQTVRHRLNKIYSILDINPKSTEEKEQLLLAIKIKICRDLLDS